MAIFGNVDLGVIDILAADTTLIDLNSLADTERYAITGMSIHNTTGASVAVDIYYSPDLTSASGQRVASLNIAANDSSDVVELVGQGSKANIIAVGAAVGLNAKISITSYSAGD